MKTKHLFYSLALASAFAACTQEELVETPVVKDNVADRPVAGVVEFTTESEGFSRYNYEWNQYQVGDIFGLYLMDEFVDGDAVGVSGHDAEHGNANGTYWKYQNHWFGMYDFTNSIQSNYPFRAVKEGNGIVWKNDAKLVEGNYFAMYPQNEKALNRRELWHSIKPAVELKPVADKTLNPNGNMYQYVENQLWLGYKQIYRDATASAEGVMKMNVNMKAVLVPLKLTLSNLSDCDVTLDKIVIKDKDGNALPTLAYFEPASYVGERQLTAKEEQTHQLFANWVVADKSKEEWYNCGNNHKAYGLFDEAKTWTKHTIQHLVKWTVPGDYGIPYGLEGAATKAAYEYSFAFPENTVVEGDVNGGDIVKVFIALPAGSEPFYNNLAVMIYGWEHKQSGDTYGYLVPNTSTSVDKNNYSFELAKYVTWGEVAEESDGDYRNVLVEFDDFSWKSASTGILAASTEDMEKNVRSILAKATTEPVEITVKPDVTGVELKASFLKELKDYSAKNTRKVEITFDGTRGGKVMFKEDNTMIDKVITTEVGDYVDFKYDRIQLYNSAEQTLTDGAQIEATAVINNEGNGKINVLSSVAGQADINGTINNYGEMLVDNGIVETINNYAFLTLKYSANVGTLNNRDDAVATIEKKYNANETVTVGTLTNVGNHGCVECDERPTLNVKDVELVVTDLLNGTDEKNVAGAILNIEAGARVKILGGATNYGHSDWDGSKISFVNRGTISGRVLGNGGILDNYGTINAPIENKATINAHAGKINDLKNTAASAKLNALSSNIEVVMNEASQGQIIYTGVVAQNIQKSGSDVAIFRTVENMEIIDLIDKMMKTGSKTLYLGHNLNLAYDNTDDNLVDVIKAFRDNFVKAVVVEGSNVKFNGALNGTYSAFKKAALSVNDNCKLNIEDYIKVYINSLAFNDTAADWGTTNGYVWVGDAATLYINEVPFKNVRITTGSSLNVQGGTQGGNANGSAMN